MIDEESKEPTEKDNLDDILNKEKNEDKNSLNESLVNDNYNNHINNLTSPNPTNKNNSLFTSSENINISVTHYKESSYR